mmetsp:Transcript_14921/g.28989  ORF Transcript_14921/g.28989 Transcript_14921/m.28989 type:complete len:655 (-) Transcript_14921:150-2114(-)|eukprot:CAMPEP_0171485236 /NCGR_PEP_ID=MMETSP0958-20121227/430_1 /TAXON_ID=87120 /ORGANISM="Aurantiochytrium limacinum, Strain ATCCMYA-1381" /LENGTH=654 /DNA_ID=CAMNT_0012017997 /DNA_START=2070 /DNA_END=4037 /DNA_ORIENTATION=+
MSASAVMEPREVGSNWAASNKSGIQESSSNGNNGSASGNVSGQNSNASMGQKRGREWETSQDYQRKLSRSTPSGQSNPPPSLPSLGGLTNQQLAALMSNNANSNNSNGGGINQQQTRALLELIQGSSSINQNPLSQGWSQLLGGGASSSSNTSAQSQSNPSSILSNNFSSSFSGQQIDQQSLLVMNALLEQQKHHQQQQQKQALSQLLPGWSSDLAQYLVKQEDQPRQMFDRDPQDIARDLVQADLLLKHQNDLRNYLLHQQQQQQLRPNESFYRQQPPQQDHQQLLNILELQRQLRTINEASASQSSSLYNQGALASQQDLSNLLKMFLPNGAVGPSMDSVSSLLSNSDAAIAAAAAAANMGLDKDGKGGAQLNSFHHHLAQQQGLPTQGASLNAVQDPVMSSIIGAVSGEFTSKFSKRYQRNNKRGGLKNLRCFPSCSETHKDRGFCGGSVLAQLQTSLSPNILREAVCFVRFARYGDSALEDGSLDDGGDPSVSPRLTHMAQQAVRRGDILPQSKIFQLQRTKANRTKPWITGDLVQAPRASTQNGQTIQTATFEFNRMRWGWHYGWVSNKHACDSEHILEALVFLPYPNPTPNAYASSMSQSEPRYICVATFSSPSFVLFCRRRKDRFLEFEADENDGTSRATPENEEDN